MAEADDLPRMLGGRYRLESVLGHGGMGIVYRGTDFMMKRAVAVKLVRASDGFELDDEVAGRFLREAKNTARLHHENIVEVYDLGRSDDGGLYLVMELLNGESLSARLKREGKINPQKTVHIARQMCGALEVAHAGGLVHRDLKPANVMLISRAGDPDFVKVLDFGVSKSFMGDQDATQLTHTGMLVGTVDYMAPEQIMGKAIDGRTDIYALGIVLYKMLCGRPPFKDTGVPALIHAHLNTMPKPLVEVVPGFPNALDHVVLRCLAKKPERRFESMTELERALEGAIEPTGVADVSFDEGSDGKTAVVVKSSPPPIELGSEDETIRVDRVPPGILRKKHESVLPIPAPPPRRNSAPPPVQRPSAFPPPVGDVTVAVNPQPRISAPPQAPLPVSHPPPYAIQQPWFPQQAPPPPPPPTIWERFLTWTGLRNR